MAATLYTSKYLCLNILSTDVKDGQIHLSIKKILIRLLNTKMMGNYRKDSRSLFQMDQNCFLNQSHTRGSLFAPKKCLKIIPITPITRMMSRKNWNVVGCIQVVVFGSRLEGPLWELLLGHRVCKLHKNNFSFRYLPLEGRF